MRVSSRVSMVLTVMCSIVALFCVIALGWGPWFFAAIGLAALAAGFRARRKAWWGLSTATGGLLLAVGALAGWRGRTVAEVVAVAFVVVAGLRFAGHSMVSPRGSR